MFAEVDTQQVKSATRVMEVLEYFTSARPEASIADIVRDLGYPQSSTSELLHCLASRGYLHFDARRRVFRPTARVAVLGAWVLPTSLVHGNVLQVMDELSQQTGEQIHLGAVVGLSVRYLHVVQATRPNRVVTPPGAVRPLLHSSMGRLLLSTLPERELDKVVLRLNAEADPQWRVSLPALKAELGEIRRRGYSLSLNTMSPGGGMISVLLPATDGGPPLALGIGGPTDQIRYLDLLRQAVTRFDPRPRTWDEFGEDDLGEPPVYRYRRPYTDGALPNWSCKATD